MRYFRINLPILTICGIIIAFIYINACDDGPTGPEVEPGRRDYTWEIDTLAVEYANLYKVWGSSPTDVWATGSGSWLDKTIWYYDGDSWSTDGISRIINPHALWGFTHNEVYIGGSDGRIWKFNGTEWSEFAKLETEGTEFISFENIWGTNPNDFYAVGHGPDSELYANYSIITHYYKGNWKIFDPKFLIGNVVHFYTNKSDQRQYFMLSKIGGITHPDSTIIYEYKDDNYVKLYVSLEAKGKYADIALIDDEVYFILGNEIATRSNNQFKNLVTIDNPNFYQRIWGRNSRDIFLLMTDGLAHYNGSDIEYLFYFNRTPQTQIFGAALFDNEVFFTVFEALTGLKYIYHGKLNN